MIMKPTFSRWCAAATFFGLVLTCSCASAPPPAAKPPGAVFTNSIGMKLEPIPAGAFWMGKDDGADSDTLVHRVTISAFWIGQFDVTNKDYDQFKHRPRPPESLTDNQPVTRISYYDALAFCRWLSKREKRTYRLPTEAEWEYAARGGLEKKDFPWGDDDPQGRASYTEPFGSSTTLETTPAGKYPPNGYGLYDMAGNVEQWTSDWYDENYYAHSPLVDPKGPVKPLKIVHDLDTEKVMRGGFFEVPEMQVWLRRPVYLDIVSDPKGIHDFEQADGSGFRVVLEPDKNHPIL